MDTNKDICVNCTKSNDCEEREEIHACNFNVSECDGLTKEKSQEERNAEKEKIKKGLYACGNSHTEGCLKCPYDKTKDCQDKMQLDALDLINEQEQEIARLKENGQDLAVKSILNLHKQYKKDLEELRQENEALKKENIKLKAKDSWRNFCSSDKPCWAKGEDNECRTIENCQHKVSEAEYLT